MVKMDHKVKLDEKMFQSALDECVKGKVSKIISEPCRELCELPKGVKISSLYFPAMRKTLVDFF
jgi:hypothetical protein